MPPRKSKKSKVTNTDTITPTAQPRHSPGAGFFPFARYISVLGVHISLLSFVALYLPRATLLLPKATSVLQGVTGDPVASLAWICAGIVPLQGWWAGWIRQWWIEFSLDGTDTEKRLERSERDQGKLTKLRNAWLTTITTSFIAYVVIIIFGAPIFSHYLHTYLLACLISLLTVFTPAYTLGIPSFASDSSSLVIRLTWTRLFAELSPRTPLERAIVYPVVGAVIGSWCGAFPIALDWERPWQAWPLTPAFGAISGYLIGSISALLVSVGQSLLQEVVAEKATQKAKVS